MERHRCKLCSRVFNNGRALGGHMRSHLAILPLPPKNNNTTHTQHHPNSLLGFRPDSDSSSTTHSSYDLNPRHCVPHEHLDDGSSVVQDRESETETQSTHNNPTRKRSKRARPSPGQNPSGTSRKKLKLDGGLIKSESLTESGPVSSVSDASQDEEVALCLMMMSRDVWERRVVEDNSVDSFEFKKIRAFTRFPRLKSLVANCKKVLKLQPNKALEVSTYEEDKRIYECPFCNKVFGSGQALGGHKRSHLLGSSTNSNYNPSVVIVSNDNDNKTSFILDLNLPAPMEDGEDHVSPF